MIVPTPVPETPEFPRRAVFALTLIALVLRLWFNLIQHPLGKFLFSDMGVYNERANHLLRGPLSPIDTFTPVGYPAFVASVYALTGGSTAAVGILHAFMGAAVCWMAAKLSWKLSASRPAAIAVCALTAGYLPLLSYGGFLMSETLASFLGMVGVLLLIRAKEDPTFKKLAAAGLALAFSTVVRPYLVLLYPLLPVYFWAAFRPETRKAWKATLAIVLVSLPVFAASAWHNSSLVGRFNLFGSNGGLNFFLAHSNYRTAEYRKDNLPNGKLEYSITPIPNLPRYQKIFRSPVPLHDDAFFYGQGLREIAADPARILTDLHNVTEGLGLGRTRYWPGWQKMWWLLESFNKSFLWLIGLPGLSLLAALAFQKRLFVPAESGRLLIGLFWTVALATLYLFLGDPRVRVPLDPVFAALAADALVRIRAARAGK